MKNKLEIFLNDRGFTLVELMVVVAIIGLISAVEIPNFQKIKPDLKLQRLSFI